METKISPRFLKLWILLSFLIPFVLFVMAFIYFHMPTFKLGSIGNNGERMLGIDSLFPWLSPFVGSVLFVWVLKHCDRSKSRVLYVLFYIIFLILLILGNVFLVREVP